MRFLETAPDRVVIAAPAKLNLYLDVLARRPDGYHEIESVMQTIDLCDLLEVRRIAGREVRLNVQGRPCPGGPGNLVLRAAAAFLSAIAEPPGLEVNLQKNVPLGAGLGGGSSDAAAMLAALHHLTGRRMGAGDLAALAASIGSDVPFFLHGGTAVARGRGEHIEPLPAPGVRRSWYCVFYPGVESSTARVYGNVNLALTPPKRNLRLLLQRLVQASAMDGSEFHNALQQPFRMAYPQCAGIQDRLSAAAGRNFHLTGSGSAMFAPVRDRDDGREVERTLERLALGEAFVCQGPCEDA